MGKASAMSRTQHKGWIMDWQQKLQAMTSLVGTFNICLKMRKPGDWYVSVQGREILEGSILAGSYGNGSTPQEAVEDDWRKCTEDLKPHQCIVTNAYGPERRQVRWNGFMWEPFVSA